MSKEKIKVEKSEIKELKSTKETVDEIVATKEGKVGTMLYDVRIKKKLSIEDVSKVLCIKPSYLSAIEQSDYKNIPEYPYGVGFVRSYAEYLGLNSVRLVQIFKEETHQNIGVSTVQDIEPTLSAEDSEIYIPNKKYILISLGLLVFIYLLWVVFSTSDDEKTISAAVDEQISQDEDYQLKIENFNQENEVPVAETVQEEAQIKITDEKFNEPLIEEKTKTVEDKIVEIKKEEKKTEETEPAVSGPKKEGRVVLKIKKETWVEVKDDDKLWISKVLKAGDEYVVPDNGQGKIVSFGNTDGVDVMIDGKVVTIVSNNKKTNINLDAFLGNH